MAFLHEEDALARVRRHRERQAATEAAVRQQAEKWGADPRRIEADIAEQRRKVLAQAETEAAETLQEIRRRRAVMAEGIVDVAPGNRGVRERQPGAIDRMIDGERLRTGKKNDPARFAYTPKRELTRLVNTVTDVVELADLRNALLLRAERGDDDARSSIAQVDVRLGQQVAALPSVQQRAREEARIAQIAEHVGYALRAIETGAEDAGLRFESYAAAQAAREAGDTRRTTLVTKPDGSSTLELPETP